MGTPQPNKITLSDIAKHPVAYAVLIMGILLGLFARGFSGAQGDRVDDCKTENVYLKQELKATKAELSSVYQRFLIDAKAKEAEQQIRDSVQNKTP
jgi:hypothetical protein